MSDRPRETHERGGAPWEAAPFGLAAVRGRSMLPTLADGDRLLVSYRRARRGAVRPGAVVVARFVDGTIAVKRVAGRADHAGASGWWLLSDNPGEGVDSRHRGAVPDHDVLAVALARVWPRPRPIRARRS